jgi:ribosome-binding protein aMBF1 (putative translation factor)
METIEKNGTTYVLVPQDAWNKIASGEMEMPAMPAADAQGRMPALEAVRVVIARGIIRDRLALGWSQAELARHAGLNVETLNRIEKARVTPDERTMNRIDKAIKPSAKSKMAKTARAKRVAGK